MTTSLCSSAYESCQRYLDKMPNAVSGSGGHNCTFQAACELFRFGLSEDESLRLLQWFNATKCQPPWSERELQHKLASARKQVTSDGEIGLRLRDRPKQRAPRSVINENLDWDSIIGVDKYSETAMDDAPPLPAPRPDWETADLRDYLEALYADDEYVAYVTKAREDEKHAGKMVPDGWGVYTRTRADIETKGLLVTLHDAWGAWIRLNPMDGQGVNDSNVIEYRHALVESDKLPIDEQWAILQRLKVPCAAVVHSAGKSLHAVVRIDAGEDKGLYDRRVQHLYDTLAAEGMIVDRQNRNPSRLSRLPGVTRQGQPQYLLDVNTGKDTWTEWADWIKSLPKPEPVKSEEAQESVDVDEKIEPPVGLVAADISRWLVDDAPPVPWSFTDTIPENCVTGITGQPAAGKSTFGATLLVSKAIGQTLLPAFVPAGAGPVMWVENEDPEIQVRRMIKKVFMGFGLSEEHHAQFLSNATIYCDQPAILAKTSYEDVIPTALYNWLKEEVARIKPSMLLFNPRVSLAHIKENDNAQLDALFSLLKGLFRVHKDMAIMVIHHSSKGGRNDSSMFAGRGAVAGAAAVRAEFTLTTLDSQDKDLKDKQLTEDDMFDGIRLTMAKQSYGQRWRNPLYMKRDAETTPTGGLLRQWELPSVDQAARNLQATDLMHAVVEAIGANLADVTMSDISQRRSVATILLAPVKECFPKGAATLPNILHAISVADFQGLLVFETRIVRGKEVSIPRAAEFAARPDFESGCAVAQECAPKSAQFGSAINE